ncbi:hypothetical protein HPP92_005679 [Vanilla planifolia]|uniref:CCR4-NOT transcription complex subunit 11 n=1 Tax=Vanilla planifolia TaxID=51239 RepID=A0A835VDE3_VANPL|nr:hypothetical protein HPP92_005679 [Vanilla planifolia]
MIGVEESKALFALLSSETRPIEDIFSEFRSRFPREVHFRIGCSIAMLLEAACDDTSEKVELAFIQQMLGSTIPGINKEVLKESALDFIEGFDSSSCNPIKVFSAMLLRNAIPDPDIPPGCDSNSSEMYPPATGAKPRIGCGDKDAAITGFCQSYLGSHELLWDYGMCADTGRGAAVRDLIAKALKGPLPPSQEQVLVELNNDPKLVYHCGLPAEATELVSTIL